MQTSVTKKHLFHMSAYILDLKVPDDEVSMNSRVLEGDYDVGVLLGPGVGPVLSTLHLWGGQGPVFNITE